MPKDYIFWNAEPISMDGWCDAKDWGPASEFHLRWHHSYELRSQWLGTMSKALAVWDYSITNKPHVEETGRSFTHVPFGYAQAYEDQFNESTQGLQIEQDIDVLFYGWMSPRRQRVLDELTRRGINVHVASFKNPAVNSSLDLLLARSKIVLGIHCYEETTAHLPDLARFDFLLSNRIFAIHERPSSSGLGTGLEDNVTTESYSNLADACDHFLTHPEERASLADRSYHWFKSAFSMEDYLPFEKIRALLTSR